MRMKHLPQELANFESGNEPSYNQIYRFFGFSTNVKAVVLPINSLITIIPNST